MTAANFMSKAFSYQDLHSGGRGGLCAPPEALSDKNTPGHIRLTDVEAKLKQRWDNVIQRWNNVEATLCKVEKRLHWRCATLI